MTLVLKPSSSGRDLISGALAADADQAAEVLELESLVGVGELLGGEVRVKGSEELETSRGGRDGKLGLGDGGRKRSGKVGRVACEGEMLADSLTVNDKRRLTSSEASGGKLVSSGRLEAKGLAISADELVLGGIEAKLAREGLEIRRISAPYRESLTQGSTYHGSDDIGGGEEVHGLTVAVVASLEVAVERGENG